jgi:hypothetical protein
MNAIFSKLNFKAQPVVYVLDAPASFDAAIGEMRGVTEIRNGLAKAKDITFAIAFASKQKEVDQFADSIAKSVTGDAVIWIAYPKGSSKKLKCEFNRDNGWARMGLHGFEPVRMISIDEDWTALRFRRVEHIKKMTRSFALTEEGRKKATKSTAKP